MVSQKSEAVYCFLTNLWCSHSFLKTGNFSTSQAKKKSCFFFKPKVCSFWTIVKQKNVSLSYTTLLSWQKEKKNFWPCENCFFYSPAPPPPKKKSGRFFCQKTLFFTTKKFLSWKIGFFDKKNVHFFGGLQGNKKKQLKKTKQKSVFSFF